MTDREIPSGRDALKRYKATKKQLVKQNIEFKRARKLTSNTAPNHLQVELNLASAMDHHRLAAAVTLIPLQHHLFKVVPANKLQFSLQRTGTYSAKVVIFEDGRRPRRCNAMRW